MKIEFGVHRVAMDSPADTSRLEGLILGGEIDPKTIIACIGKTEGNGGANDFTRALATVSYQSMLSKYIGEGMAKKISFVWSGGTEGVLSPHATFFTNVDVEDSVLADPSDKRLAIGIQETARIPPEEIGRPFMVHEVVQATLRAMKEIGVTDAKDVHYVQVKGPLLTPAGIGDAAERNKPVVTTDPNLSKGYARGAMALGVAIALDEIDMADLSLEDIINKDLSLYSNVASTSAGGELTHCEIILMANSNKSASPYRIGHSYLADAIDAAGVFRAMRSAGIAIDDVATPEHQHQVTAVFAKAEARTVVRGCRTTMYSDADINYERHARAAAGAVMASVIGCSTIFVSGGTEHQCEPGCAPIAVIAKV